MAKFRLTTTKFRSHRLPWWQYLRPVPLLLHSRDNASKDPVFVAATAKKFTDCDLLDLHRIRPHWEQLLWHASLNLRSHNL
jgi:hypothetical protein